MSPVPSRHPKIFPKLWFRQALQPVWRVKMFLRLKKKPKRNRRCRQKKNVVGEEPKVGVFICDCGENIGGVIDVDTLVDQVSKLDKVAVVQAEGHGCSRESMEHIRRTIEEQGINRVVVGGCSPRTHESKFQDLIRKSRVEQISTGVCQYPRSGNLGSRPSA